MRAFPSGEDEHKVSRDGGLAPRWRGDGREVFFLSLDATMMAARVETTPRFNAMSPQSLFPTGLNLLDGHTYDVRRDGQWFLMPVKGERRATIPLTLILNWKSKLPQ